MRKNLQLSYSMINILVLIILAVVISCGRSYDPVLAHPDIDDAGIQHGYILTPLGCLLFSPLAYIEGVGGYNIATYYQGKEISSLLSPYTPLQKELVFEFERNGRLKYWLKKDYIKSPIDAKTDHGVVQGITHEIHRSSELQLRKIYDNGKWQCNFADSTLTIDFGNNDLGLQPLVGKFTSLGAGRMAFQQTSAFDSLINGKSVSCTKKINSYFEGY